MAINAIGPVGAFGSGYEQWRTSLLHPTTTAQQANFRNLAIPDSGFPACRVTTEDLNRFISRKEIRRLDHFSRLALLGACLASSVHDQIPGGRRCGLILATAYGATATTFSFLDTMINDGDAMASPTLFSNSVHNAAAAHIARHLKISGPNLSLSQPSPLLLPMALQCAANWLEEGRVDQVLCGVVDEYCEVYGYCWQCLQKTNCGFTTAPGRVAPSLSLGEGSLFLLLSRPEKTTARFGFLEKIAMNPKSIPDDIMLVGTRISRGLPDQEGPPLHRLIDLNLGALCGDFPAIDAFALAATATILAENTLPDKLETGFKTSAGNPPGLIGCWQPWEHDPRKQLTGNLYWVTNRPE
ncbi:MAG TPA: hypothetical protein ENN66_03025 [Proteobacteria bacterium]|nr:hypothetical protein [Pseudomonadota bacterium]